MILVDITPMAINKTAMYHVVRDTVKYFVLNTKLEIKLICANNIIDTFLFSENGFALTAEQDANARNNFFSCIHDKNRFMLDSKMLEPAELIIFFDPLYNLVYELTAIKKIVFVLDLTVVTKPEWHGDVVAKKYQEAFLALYRPDTKIISISSSTSRDLWANYGIGKDKVATIDLYNRFDEKKLERNIKKQFLFVGSLEKRKNILGIMEAFALSCLAKDGFSLRIVGGNGCGHEDILAKAGQTNGIFILGKISDEDLLKEYSEAICLVYPSFWEGFGLPFVEALNANIPIILSDTGAFKDIDPKFAIFVDPYRVGDIANAMKMVATDNYRYYNADERINYLKKYSFDAYVEKLIVAIDEFKSKQVIYPKKQNQEALAISINKRSSRLRKFLLENIILESIRDVPKDSFSTDYLLLLQQSMRVKLILHVKSIFDFKKIYLLPVRLIQLPLYLATFKFYALLIKAQLNEIYALRQYE